MPHRKEWMTDDQWHCWQMLARVRKGFHHINGNPRPWGTGIKVSVPDGWSTFDFDQLTRLVVACHQWCVRVEVVASSPRRLGLCLWKRKREGLMYQRHPTIYDAVDGMVANIGSSPA